MAILGVFAFILATLLPVGIIALIVAAAVNKEKGNDASKFALNVKAVYTYVIVIATLFMIISGTIVAVPSILDYFLPESELEASYDEQYKEEHELIVRNERHEGLINFTSSLAIVIIATPIFVSYSMETKKLRIEKIEVKQKPEKTVKAAQAKKVSKPRTTKTEKK